MPLNINFQQILLHMFNFVILAFGLYMLLYKPVVAFMKKREDHFADLEKQAQEAKSQAEATLAEYNAKLAGADEEIRQKNAAAAQEAEEVLQASRAECMRLNQQLLTLQGIQHEYQVSLETMRASSSWRLTAPLRKLLTLLRGH